MTQELYSFFLVTAPGLEQLALDEWSQKSRYLREIYPDLMSKEEDIYPRIVTGGVELFLKEQEGWILNHYLRIPTRILQRLVTFQCRNYERLEAKVRHLEWHHYLRQGEVEVHPSYHRSYLNMKKRIQEEVQKGLAHFERHQAFRKVHLDEPQGIYVRIVNNEATISLDTSGNLLHRRGYKTNTVEAPVRETLGAALYWMCYQELGGVPEIILDPMAGSGTLVMEPMIFWSSWRRRNFAYQNFPCASKRLSVETTQALPPIETMPRLLAGDTSEKATSALKENFSALAKKEKWNIDIRQGDWLDVWAENELAGQGLMLLNPPYNLRLEADQEALAQQLQSFVKKVRPSLVGVIWPGRKLPVIEGKWVQHVTTTNGGVPVSLGVLRP